MIIFSILWLIPVLWMIDTAIKPTPEILQPSKMAPEKFTLQHIKDVINNWPFGTWLLNSIIVSGLSTLFSLFINSCCLFFSRIEWKGRDVILLSYWRVC